MVNSIATLRFTVKIIVRFKHVPGCLKHNDIGNYIILEWYDGDKKDIQHLMN